MPPKEIVVKVSEIILQETSPTKMTIEESPTVNWDFSLETVGIN